MRARPHRPSQDGLEDALPDCAAGCQAVVADWGSATALCALTCRLPPYTPRTRFEICGAMPLSSALIPAVESSTDVRLDLTLECRPRRELPNDLPTEFRAASWRPFEGTLESLQWTLSPGGSQARGPPSWPSSADGGA